MANTYTSINIHYVFSTKNREPFLTGDIRERVWAFMGGIARENGMTARTLNYVCAKLGADLTRLHCRTWSASKKANCLQEAIDLYVAYHNGYFLE